MCEKVIVVIACLFATMPVMADLTRRYNEASLHLGGNVACTGTGVDRILTIGHYKIDVQDDTGDIVGAPGMVHVFCIDVWDQDNWNSSNQAAAALQNFVWQTEDALNTDSYRWATDPVVATDWGVETGLFLISNNAVIQDLANAMLSNVMCFDPLGVGNFRGVSDSTDASHRQDYVVHAAVSGNVLLGILEFDAADLKLREVA